MDEQEQGASPFGANSKRHGQPIRRAAGLQTVTRAISAERRPLALAAMSSLGDMGGEWTCGAGKRSRIIPGIVEDDDQEGGRTPESAAILRGKWGQAPRRLGASPRLPQTATVKENRSENFEEHHR